MTSLITHGHRFNIEMEDRIILMKYQLFIDNVGGHVVFICGGHNAHSNDQLVHLTSVQERMVQNEGILYKGKGIEKRKLKVLS